MASTSNPNGLRAITGGQAGTLDIQFILIRCYNSAFTLTATAQDPYEFISDPNDGFAKIVAVVQDFAEIYYIGIPEANSGGESDLTRVIIGVNPVSARGLPTDLAYPSATGRWTDLETALNAQIGGGNSEAWFGIPGYGWNWFYND
jgi:hypothetical protein